MSELICSPPVPRVPECSAGTHPRRRCRSAPECSAGTCPRCCCRSALPRVLCRHTSPLPLRPPMSALQAHIPAAAPPSHERSAGTHPRCRSAPTSALQAHIPAAAPPPQALCEHTPLRLPLRLPSPRACGLGSLLLDTQLLELRGERGRGRRDSINQARSH